MAFLIWFLAGTGAVIAAFFVNDSSVDLWPATNAGGLVACLYIVALIVYAVRRPMPRRDALIVVIPAFFGLVSLASAWTGHEMQSRYQHSVLLEIRTVIARGIFDAQESKVLLETLEAYYAVGDPRKRDLRREFLTLAPGAEVGRDIYVPQWDRDTSRCRFVRTLDKDKIELVALDKVAFGNDRTFANEGGSVGRVQERYILTPEGLQHATDN